jgi:hypothetical protein
MHKKFSNQGEHFMRGFGRATYNMPAQDSEFDARLKKLHDGQPLTTDEDFETIANNLSADQIKTLFNKASRNDQEKADALRSKQDADAFVKLRPEFMDTGKNGRILRAHCMTAFGTAHPTLEQWDAGFQALAANNLLELDKAELARQADAATTSRAAQVKSEAFNGDDEYSDLDLDEIRRRANNVLNRG